MADNALIGSTQLCVDTNPIRFENAWSGFPDNATNKAAICNDTNQYKTLMIVGNKSAGISGGVRRVSVWDRLEVNGDLVVTGKTTLTGPLTLPGAGLVISGLQPAPAGGNYDNVVIDLATGKLYSRD